MSWPVPSVQPVCRSAKDKVGKKVKVNVNPLGVNDCDLTYMLNYSKLLHWRGKTTRRFLRVLFKLVLLFFFITNLKLFTVALQLYFNPSNVCNA